jgi:hypothetical protein
MKQTDEIAEMRGTMKSFIDFELAAKQRLEIRVETEALIEKAVNQAMRTIIADCRADIAQMRSEVTSYADAKVRELETRLVAQEDRDKKRETDIRIQFIGLGVVATAGVAYALLSAMQRIGGG